MNPPLVAHPLLNVDHPVIIICQLLLAAGLFRVFFAIHARPSPIPLVMGVMPWLIILNIYARIGHETWFWITDTVMWFWFVVITFYSLRYSRLLVKQEAERLLAGGLPPAVPEHFQSFRTRASWAFGLVCFAMVVYHSITMWNDAQASNAANAKVRVATEKKVFEQQQGYRDSATAQRKAGLRNQDTIKAQNDLMLKQQHINQLSGVAIQAEQRSVAKDKLRDKNTSDALIRRTASDVDTTKREVRRLKGKRGTDQRFNEATPDEGDDLNSPEHRVDPDKKPSFWDRVTKPFRSRKQGSVEATYAPLDTIEVDTADSVRTTRKPVRRVKKGDSLYYVNY